MERMGIAALGVLLSGLLAVSTNSVAQDMQATHIAVEGPAKRIYEFHQILKGIVVAVFVEGDLAKAGVDCSFVKGGVKDCSELDPNSSGSLRLDYVTFRDA